MCDKLVAFWLCSEENTNEEGLIKWCWRGVWTNVVEGVSKANSTEDGRNDPDLDAMLEEIMVDF